MSIYSKTNAHVKALELVNSAMQTGVIKLTGPHNGGTEYNNAAIATDVAYLNGLINGIAKNLTNPAE